MPAEDITIQGAYTTGIDAFMEDKTNVKIYNINGQNAAKTYKGIKIIRSTTGNTKKLFTK